MLAQRHAEAEPVVDAVFIHLSHVVVDAAGAEHRTGDASVNGEFSRQATDTLRARHEDFIPGQQGFILVKEAREFAYHLLRLFEPARRQVTTATAEAHVIAHHPRPGEGLEEVEDLFTLAEGIHQRRAGSAHILEEEADEGDVVLKAGQLSGDHPDIFRALRRLQPGQLLDRKRIGPVIGQRTKIIQPVSVRHGPEVSRVLADLLVVAMQVTEHRLELHHPLAIQCDVHPKHAMSRGVLRPHRDFEQLAFQRAVRRRLGTKLVIPRWLSGFEIVGYRVHSLRQPKLNAGFPP